MPEEPTAGHVQRWCAGLPQVGEAALSDAQRALVSEVYTRTRTRAFAYTGFSMLLLPVSIGLIWQLRAVFGERSWVPVAGALMLLFFGLPLVVAKTIAQVRLAWPLGKDLARGAVLEFAGTIADAAYEQEDPDVVALVEVGAIQRGAGEQLLGVLPSSARLISVNGRDVLPERRLHVATTATTEHALPRYSLPPDMKHAFGMQRGLKRRRFGDSERRELVEHIARLTAVPWMLVVLTAFVAITVSSWIVRGMESAHELMGLGWIVAWTIVAVRHVRSYLLARRFEDDLEVGWLLSWETPSPTDVKPSAGSGRMPFSTAEVLPVSQMDWMIDGKPAAWRRVIQRASS
jgi:hypothetical protein